MRSLASLLHRSLVLVGMLAGSLPSRIALAAENSTAIADGRVFNLPEFAISITPPSGWQIMPNYMGKALVLQPVPKQEKIKDYSKPIYNRNITVAILHQPRPIDETEALSLRKKLEMDFGLAAGVTEFQIVEHRFIDYRGKADALLLYTAFKLNGFPMSQMHVFLSGSKNAALLTYTDLADAFQNDESAMALAWTAMLSTDLNGLAPQRYENMLYAGAGLGAFLMAACSFLLLRRRSASRLYQDAEERLYRDETGDKEHNSAVTALATDIAARSTYEEEAEAVSDVWNLASSLAATSSTPVRASKKRRSAVSSY